MITIVSYEIVCQNLRQTADGLEFLELPKLHFALSPAHLCLLSWPLVLLAQQDTAHRWDQSNLPFFGNAIRRTTMHVLIHRVSVSAVEIK